jgi:CheY-like chemotaxis protein
VVGDEGRVRQILLNLVGNALKFTEAGHVRLAVSCEETARGPEGPTAVRLRFDIEDTGIGIAPDKLATIFNQFEQADNTTTRRFGGTGLGLSISRQLAEAMGGTITVASIVGNGSVFSFQVDMPVADVSVSAKSEPTLGLPSGTPILVVDDHEATRAVLAEQLERFGAKPVCVPSASAALSAMKRAHDVHNFRFPLVVTDHDMPGLTGLDLVERVRATPELHDTPFVIATTSPSNLIADAYARLGVVDILEKPYPTQRMTEVVLNHLAETQLSALKTIAQTQPAAAAATQVPLRRSA